MHKDRREKAIDMFRKPRGAIGSGTMYLIFMIFLLVIAGFLFAGAKFPDPGGPREGQAVIPVYSTPEPNKNNLQLYTFGFVTPTPVPIITDANKCISNSFDEEGQSGGKSNIFIALDPPPGGVANATGKIRAWIRDEHGAGTAPGSVMDPTTGEITSHDPTDFSNKGGINFLLEPSLYLTELTPANQNGPWAGDIENANPPSPKFPAVAKGKVRKGDGGEWVPLPAPDPDWANFIREQRVGEDPYLGEFIWNVANLGLTPGKTYRAQIVVWDGDGDLAIDCTTITMQ